MESGPEGRSAAPAGARASVDLRAPRGKGPARDRDPARSLSPNEPREVPDAVRQVDQQLQLPIAVHVDHVVDVHGQEILPHQRHRVAVGHDEGMLLAWLFLVGIVAGILAARPLARGAPQRVVGLRSSVAIGVEYDGPSVGELIHPTPEGLRQLPPGGAGHVRGPGAEARSVFGVDLRQHAEQRAPIGERVRLRRRLGVELQHRALGLGEVRVSRRMSPQDPIGDASDSQLAALDEGARAWIGLDPRRARAVEAPQQVEVGILGQPEHVVARVGRRVECGDVELVEGPTGGNAPPNEAIVPLAVEGPERLGALRALRTDMGTAPLRGAPRVVDQVVGQACDPFGVEQRVVVQGPGERHHGVQPRSGFGRGVSRALDQLAQGPDGRVGVVCVDAPRSLDRTARDRPALRQRPPEPDRRALGTKRKHRPGRTDPRDLAPIPPPQRMEFDPDLAFRDGRDGDVSGSDAGTLEEDLVRARPEGFDQRDSKRRGPSLGACRSLGRRSQRRGLRLGRLTRRQEHRRNQAADPSHRPEDALGVPVIPRGRAQPLPTIFETMTSLLGSAVLGLVSRVMSTSNLSNGVVASSLPRRRFSS